MLRDALTALRSRRLAGKAAAAPATVEREQATARLREAARLSPEEVLRAQGSGPAGLSSEAAAEQLRQHGRNQVAHERPPHWSVQLWHGFANAFSALLAVLAVVSWLTEDIRSAIVIGMMVALS